MFFFSSRRRHTRCLSDWSSDVCSSDLDLVACLRLLARRTPPLESARGLSPEEAARALHGAMEEASRDSVTMLLSSVSQYGPREGERPQPYLLRLSEHLIFEFLNAEFSGGSLTA